MKTSALFCFCVSYIILHPCFSQAQDFSLDVSLGIQGGISREYVYEGEKRISRLDWQDAVIPALHIAAGVEFANVFTRLYLDSAIPAKSGTIEDYDYMVSGSSKPSQYSQHDVYLDKDYSGGIEAGYSFKIAKWNIKPYLGFSYSNRKWTAQDGYLQYPPSGELWTGNEAKQDVSGPVISYEQALWYPLIGVAVEYTLKERFTFALGGSVAPYLWANTIDSHHLRSVRFYDELLGGFYLGSHPCKHTPMALSTPYWANRSICPSS